VSALRVPVMVMGEHTAGDVGLVRSLGIAGVPVHLLTPYVRGSTAASRYVHRIHAFPGPEAPVAERMAALRRIATAIGGRPPVMMAGDGPLALISENREQLGDVLTHDLPPREVVDVCFFKDQFAVHAQRLGLPTPETFVPANAGDVEARAATLSYPVFVKPFTKRAWGGLPAGVVEAQKGQRVDRAEDLVALFRRLAPHGADTALVQSFVPSPDTEHYSVHAYVAPDGRFVGGFTTRKIRVWPPHRGVGCLVKSERNVRLVELTRDALARLGYRGFALVQYKRHVEADRYVLLEINCRFSTSGELPARCGANFPAVSYATLTGGAPPAIAQREGPRWVDFEKDFAAFREYRVSGEWTWAGYLASLLSVRSCAFFAVDDPRPFLRRAGFRIRQRLAPWDSTERIARGPAADEAQP